MKPYHGRTGPFPIRHQRYDDLTTSLRGFIDATVAEGFSRVEDSNGPNPSGVGGYPVNVVDGVRQNTGLVYLTEEVRNRPNLHDQPFYYNGYALKPEALDMRPAVGDLLWRQSSEARGMSWTCTSR